MPPPPPPPPPLAGSRGASQVRASQATVEPGPRPGAPGSGAPGSGAPGVPTRDELTLAWGDTILPALRPAVKVYVATGRFLASDEGRAVLAVPDRGLLTRAEANRAEIEAALASHFGRRVDLKLVIDPDATGPNGGAPMSAQPDVDANQGDPEAFDPEELEDAPGALTSPEQRLLEAFPGAEEVEL